MIFFVDLVDDIIIVDELKKEASTAYQSCGIDFTTRLGTTRSGRES